MKPLQTNIAPSPTVLVVDDGPGQVDLLTRFLTQQGISILSACDGQQCLEKIQTASVDTIILDVLIPKVTGLEVCRVLRGKGATRKIPIIILTATDDPETRQAGRQLGVEAFLVKPVSGKELLAHVQAHINGAKAWEHKRHH